MAYKEFDKELHDLYDKPAKDAVAAWASKAWNCSVTENIDRYGIDLVARREGVSVAFIEVETRVWSNTLCPFKTIHVAHRKRETLNNNLPTIFFAVTKDFKHGYWCNAKDLLASPVVEIKNREVLHGEMFFDVPIQKFYLVKF